MSATIQAQNVGVGTSTPAASAKLDVTSTNSGVLIPRVALTMTTAAGPVAAPANSLLVYNTATVADVTPGFYYWSSTASAWIRLAEGAAGWLTTGNTGIGAANFLGTINAADLTLSTTNTPRAVITAGGNMGVGDLTPAALFTVGAGDLFQVVSTGHARGINGTAGLPSFSFVNSTTMGMYRSAADELSFSTASTQRAVITSTGILGINIAAPAASAQLDVTATDKGVLVPRIALTATNLAAPVTTPANSLLVYNTATAGAGATAVTPGFYYWRSATSTWVRFLNADNSPVSVSLAVDRTISNAAWTAVPGMTVTFTATKSTALVQFSSSGFAYTNSMAFVQFRVMNGATSLGGTNTHMQNYDDVTGTVTPWSCTFTKNITGLTPGTTYTFTLQAQRNGIYGTYDAVINAASIPDNHHMTLTVFP